MLRRSLIIIIVTLLFCLSGIAVAQDDIVNNAEARLTSALNTSQITLDDVTKEKLASKCKNAQIIIRQLQLEADRSAILRIKTYSSINADLQAIKLRTLRQGLDSSETDLLSGKMQLMIDQFTIDADKYRTTLEDLVGLNCAEKPELFMAGLMLARTQRTKLYSEANNIKSLIKNSKNDIFNQLKKRLTL
jgi:hypothetical protein